jgi:hypothetical protein
MTTPIGSASNFILNITELQNTITSAGGTTPINQLAATVAQLQEMVIYEEKRIRTNTISAYNTTPIQVTDSMNFAAGAGLTLNGGVVSTVTGGGAGRVDLAAVSTIGYYTSFTEFYSTSGAATDLAIAFRVEGAGGGPVRPVEITAGGGTTIAGGLTLTTAGTPALGRYLTCMDALGTAEWQDPGSVSDLRWKEDVRRFDDYWRVLEGVQGVRFRWASAAAGGRSGPDVGVIAQDVLTVLPEAVIEGVDGRPHRVTYEKLVPVLVEAVKELRARVGELEKVCETCGRRP